MNINPAAASTPEIKVNRTVVPPKSDVVEEPKFQHYSYSRVSTQLVTEKGKLIKFNNYEFITSDKECIDYLDEQIAGGLIGFAKGKLLTASEANPKERLKKEIIAEYLANQEKLKAPGRDFGKTEGAIKTGAASTKHVANGLN